MTRKPKSILITIGFAFLLSCVMTGAGAAAQTAKCPVLRIATGQPGWMLVSGPGVTTPRTPTTVTPYSGWQSPPLPGSSWISPDANYGKFPGTAGDYTYESTFCLCRDGKHTLNLSFYADNGATVYFNNSTIFTTMGSYNFSGAPKVVNYTFAGGPGTNKVRIVVHNDGGPTGMDAVLRITGAKNGSCCSTLNTATGQPGWMLVSGPGVNIPKPAVSVTPYPGWQNPPLAGSNWISVDANHGSLQGDYTYEYTFCVCEGGKHSLSLSFFADNGATVYLNNTIIFATSGDYNFKLPAHVVNYGWVSPAGTNKVRIVVRNAGGPTGFDGVLSITGATSPGCPGTSSGSVTGRVVDPNNTPVSGAEVSVTGRTPVLTNSKGEFSIPDLADTERLVVNFIAPGFMNTTRIYAVRQSSGGGNTVVIWPRAKAVQLDAERGGRVSFADGGGVTIPPNSLVDGDGVPIKGPVMVSLTQLDVSDARQLKGMSGDFKAQMSDKSVRMLESLGVFEIVVADDKGRRADLAPGRTARFDLPVPKSLRPRAPRRSRLFSFNNESGFWIEEGEVVLTEQLVYSGTITRFDWDWNVDNPLDTTCITVKFIDIYGSNAGPIAGALVEATGVTYNTISSGYTNSQGLVCLLVKINSAITIKAYDPNYPGTYIGPLNVQSPNIVSGASDCGDPVLCPLVITVQQDAVMIPRKSANDSVGHLSRVQRRPRNVSTFWTAL